MRRLLPALVLVLMAPLTAEMLAGSTPLVSQPSVLAVLLLVYLPLYGGGALLIREVVSRAGRGWVSILLLGAAFGFVEEGFASQSLFNPTLYRAADHGARFLGVNGVFTESVIGVHALWSAAVPILITELLFPRQRGKPYLGMVGLLVASFCYLVGVALLWVVARTFFAAGFEAAPVLPALAVVLALALTVVALRIVPATTPRVPHPGPAPTPGLVLLVAGVGGFVAQAVLFLWAPLPAVAEWPLVLAPMVMAAALTIGIARLVNRWSHTRGWDDRHLLALAAGAVGCHALVGVLANAQTTADRAGLVVLALAMIGAFAWFDAHLRNRLSATDQAAPAEMT